MDKDTKKLSGDEIYNHMRQISERAFNAALVMCERSGIICGKQINAAVLRASHVSVGIAFGEVAQMIVNGYDITAWADPEVIATATVKANKAENTPQGKAMIEAAKLAKESQTRVSRIVKPPGY